MKLNAYAKLILKYCKNAFEITCTNSWNVCLMLYILPGAKQKHQKGEPVDKSLNIPLILQCYYVLSSNLKYVIIIHALFLYLCVSFIFPLKSLPSSLKSGIISVWFQHPV